jgi:hypothetical protein
VPLTKDIVDWPRLEVMSSVGPRLHGLLCSRQQSVPGFHHALVVDGPVDMFCISNKSREGQSLFPLFVRNVAGPFPSGTENQWRANLGDRFARQLANTLCLGDVQQRQLHNDVAAIALNYVYAILYSPSYRSRYEDLLKMDYPRIPLAVDQNLLSCLAELGGGLVALHLLETSKVDRLVTEFIGRKNSGVEKVSWSEDTVWIDKGQTIGFRGVRESTWNFQIGAYQICEKWLKDRKGRTLSRDDISHYNKIVVALAETICVMKEIDEVIEQHGGWPHAFQSSR